MRGLFDKYTIPLWYGYDTALTKPTLLEIIEQVQDWGYHVAGIVCDNYIDNQKLAQSLGATEDNPRFPNPSERFAGEFIYFLFDPVHLLKLMRNHFIDQGVYSSNFFLFLQGGLTQKKSFFKIANSQYFFVKISWIGPWVSGIE